MIIKGCKGSLLSSELKEKETAKIVFSTIPVSGSINPLKAHV